MKQFYEQVEKGLEKITSFEEARARIDELNNEIINALKERSKYPLCEDCFKDDLWWEPVYYKIVGQICYKGEPIDKKGEFFKDVANAEYELERLICERIVVGIKVAEYKRENGMRRYDPRREDEIIAKARAGAEMIDLDPKIIKEIFISLMSWNKQVQNLYENGKIPESVRDIVNYFE